MGWRRGSKSASEAGEAAGAGFCGFVLAVARRGGGFKPVEKTLGRILWNEAFAAGYPESLKVAHHLSVFSKSEDHALKALVTKRFGLRRVAKYPG